MQRRAALLTILLAGCPGGDPQDGGASATDSTTVASTTSTNATGTPTTMTESMGSPTGTGTMSTTADSTAADTGETTDDTTTGPVGDAEQCEVEQFCADPTEDGVCRHALNVGDGMLYYWSSLPLGTDREHLDCRARVERIVLVSHGNSRNPWGYYDSIQDAAVLAGVEHETLIVAPYFMAPEDNPPEGFHAWDPGGTGWKSGHDSITDPPTSSFAIVDQLIVQQILDTGQYPAVTEVVITGHSAGGQLAQRHAVSTALEDAPAMQRLGLRHIVANPSSFLYLDEYRWDGQGSVPAIDFEIPSGTGCDGSYNDYKYGLLDLPAGHYVETALPGIPDRYIARDVTYLLGEDDTDADSGLDTSCSANLQGSQRFERGLVYAAYLDDRYPAQSHAVVTVPGVGHSQSQMYESDEGVATLFAR